MLKTSENNYFDLLQPISFSEEFQQIKQFIENKNKVFNYRYTVATSRNLEKSLKENPLGLHFSGHCFQNNKSLFKDDEKAWRKNQNKGDVLLFENENGSSEFFFESQLKKMIEDIIFDKQLNQNLQFVFVASCHSEKVGKIFSNSGISHVICINQNQTILDDAAIEFSKYFYDQIFGDQKVSICEAFIDSKEKVKNKYADAEKIILLKNHDYQNCPQLQDERFNLKDGQMKQIGIEYEIMILPNKVTPFLGRNQDMFDVL